MASCLRLLMLVAAAQVVLGLLRAAPGAKPTLLDTSNKLDAYRMVHAFGKMPAANWMPDVNISSVMTKLPTLKTPTFGRKATKDFTQYGDEFVVPYPDLDLETIGVSEMDEANNLPANGKVALLFRGETFKGHRDMADCWSAEPCYSRSMGAVDSVLEKLVRPLESRGNTVEVFFSECARKNLCSETRHITEALHFGTGKGVIAEQHIPSDSQGQCMKNSLDWFEEKSGGSEKYHLVLVLRPDLGFDLPINKWPTANFAGFNFFSGCEAGAFPEWHSKGAFACVNDVFHAMPGRLFPKWKGIVATDNCFRLSRPGHKSHGHWCYNQTVQALGSENIHFATNFRPARNVRDGSDIGKLVECK